jgi:hypothetical protein
MTPALATLFLAQAADQPADFGPWLANLMYLALTVAAIIGGLAAWKSYRAKDPETPQPLVVQQHTEFVPRPDFDKAMREAHGRMNRERDEANAKIAAVAETAALVREKLDGELAAMSAKIDANNDAGREREGRINDRIDAVRDTVATMPERTVNLLRSTKGLL